ncbi:MAG: hypothetical protein K0Q49_359 [Haloplasmataceae bacterium]|jgi:hypothetical protein|nr:hypothetical protein [Haloplasmataceae bacterium]
MIKFLLLLLLILHTLGDIYFKQKEVTKYKNIILQSFLYLLLFLLPFLFFEFNNKFLLLALFCAITSFILNNINYIINNKKLFKKINNTNFIKTNLFFILQFIQISLIFLFTFIFYDQLDDNNLAQLIYKHICYIKWIFALLLIGKPSNIIFKQIFMQFKPSDKTSDGQLVPMTEKNKTYKNAGAAIGTLERILILICLVNNLYSSIGLILTAKSIARYNRISEDPEFSEYYLLGTLSSVLFTIIIYFISFNLF